MAIPHAKPGEVVDIRPLGAELQDTQTTTLVKTDRVEVIRLVLPAGKEIKRHKRTPPRARFAALSFAYGQ